jgi:benzoyl-CoA-dihydrodiol lyase
VPLLGVLPGTGGLTRVTDKRKVRHDLADIFCTTSEGVRGQKAKDWRLVDDIAKPAQFAARVQERALRAGARQRPPGRRQGRGADAAAAHRSTPTRCATACHGGHRPRQAHRHLHRQGPPARSRPTSPASKPPAPTGTRCDGARAGRRHPEMRTNELDIGTWLIKTEGDAAAVLAMDATLLKPTRTTGWCARPSACCAAPSAAWTCPRAACLR